MKLEPIRVNSISGWADVMDGDLRRPLFDFTDRDQRDGGLLVVHDEESVRTVVAFFVNLARRAMRSTGTVSEGTEIARVWRPRLIMLPAEPPVADTVVAMHVLRKAAGRYVPIV